MHTFTAIFAALFGLAFGSFLNVCISRLPQGESVVRPRSRCPYCRKEIRALDNLPLLSWLLLRGRCRGCDLGISPRYPAVEAMTAGLFLLCFLTYGISARGEGAAMLCFLLLGLAVMDAETMLLPDAFTLPGIVLGVIYSAIRGATRIRPTGLPNAIASTWVGIHAHLFAAISSALSAAVAASLLMLIRWTYRFLRRQEGMGLGDVKLMALIGAWMGPEETLLVFFLAVVSGALYGSILIAAARIRHAEHPGEVPTEVPFGTFLCLAGLGTLFWGPTLLAWYFRFAFAS